ncbi:MAG: hypothetical protein M3T55_04540 [Pseudomonadota bacterium]|nr:hypothetical protein [Pseudomonadota bacterium]
MKAAATVKSIRSAIVIVELRVDFDWNGWSIGGEATARQIAPRARIDPVGIGDPGDEFPQLLSILPAIV